MLHKKIFIAKLSREIFYAIKAGLGKEFGSFTIISIPTVESLKTIIHNRRADLIILSNELSSDINYLDLCREIKKYLNETMLIIVAERPERRERIIEVLNSGLVEDYFSSWVCEEELSLRINSHLRYLVLRDEMKRKNMLLKKSSATDIATGALNRRPLLERLNEELLSAKRYKHPVSILLVDLDHLKKINSDFGNKEGDRVLQEVAKIFKRTLRLTDVIGRYAGGGFLILLTHTGMSGAVSAAERIRNNVENYSPWVKFCTNCTVSIGLTCYDGGGGEIKVTKMVEIAERVLHQAKTGGGNRVCAMELTKDSID
ncbi:MAG: diguanylate cyclase [Candidatus Omnitrophota bacterium]